MGRFYRPIMSADTLGRSVTFGPNRRQINMSYDDVISLHTCYTHLRELFSLYSAGCHIANRYFMHRSDASGYSCSGMERPQSTCRSAGTV